MSIGIKGLEYLITPNIVHQLRVGRWISNYGQSNPTTLASYPIELAEYYPLPLNIMFSLALPLLFALPIVLGGISPGQYPPFPICDQDTDASARFSLAYSGKLPDPILSLKLTSSQPVHERDTRY